MVGDRDVLFLKRHCQGESLDIGWSGRAERETISRSGVLVYKCGESGLVIQECGSSDGGRACIRLFKLN